MTCINILINIVKKNNKYFLIPNIINNKISSGFRRISNKTSFGFNKNGGFTTNFSIIIFMENCLYEKIIKVK